MDAYKNKSHEELRFEDYVQVGKCQGGPTAAGATGAATGFGVAAASPAMGASWGPSMWPSHVQ